MKFKCLENINNETRDVVIVTVPWTDSSIPLMAPAQLKPIVESAGMSCLATDINAEVFAWTQNHEKANNLLRFFFDEQLVDDVKDELFNLFESLANQILAWNPKIVGLSLFSYVSQSSARWLAWFIKKINPSVIIIVGGAGCLPTFTGPSVFAEDLISAGWIDYHLRGDGEHADERRVRRDDDVRRGVRRVHRAVPRDVDRAGGEVREEKRPEQVSVRALEQLWRRQRPREHQRARDVRGDDLRVERHHPQRVRGVRDAPRRGLHEAVREKRGDPKRARHAAQLGAPTPRPAPSPFRGIVRIGAPTGRHGDA